MGQQIFQQIEFLGGEFDGALAAKDLAGAAVEAEVFKFQLVGVNFLIAAQMGTHAGQQFFHAEGFDHVVVCPCI